MVHLQVYSFSYCIQVTKTFSVMGLFTYITYTKPIALWVCLHTLPTQNLIALWVCLHTLPTQNLERHGFVYIHYLHKTLSVMGLFTYITYTKPYSVMGLFTCITYTKPYSVMGLFTYITYTKPLASWVCLHTLPTQNLERYGFVYMHYLHKTL